jgi:hypothetical protein
MFSSCADFDPFGAATSETRVLCPVGGADPRPPHERQPRNGIAPMFPANAPGRHQHSHTRADTIWQLVARCFCPVCGAIPTEEVL